MLAILIVAHTLRGNASQQLLLRRRATQQGEGQINTCKEVKSYGNLNFPEENLDAGSDHDRGSGDQALAGY